LSKSFEYIFKGPITSGISLDLKKLIFNGNEIYKYDILNYTKQLNIIKDFNKLKQLEMQNEQANIEITISKCKELHFYSIIKPIVKDFFNDFLNSLQIVKQHMSEHPKQVYSFIVKLQDLDVIRIYRLLANILNLFFIMASFNIKRNKIYFCKQLANIILYNIIGKGFKTEKLVDMSAEYKSEYLNFFKRDNDKTNLINFGFYIFYVLKESFLSNIFNINIFNKEGMEYIEFSVLNEIIEKYKLKMVHRSIFGLTPMVIPPIP
jgi:hypothetical protein